MKNLIGRADSKNRPANFTWDELNQFLVNVGQAELNYDSFQQAYDADPALQAIVDQFDDNGVELKSKLSAPDVPSSDAELDGTTVSQMAKRATDKEFK